MDSIVEVASQGSDKEEEVDTQSREELVTELAAQRSAIPKTVAELDASVKESDFGAIAAILSCAAYSGG